MAIYTFYVTHQVLESCYMGAEAGSEEDALAKVKNEMEDDMPMDWDWVQCIEDTTEFHLSEVTAQDRE
jgi:hypothetical protein